MRTMPFGFVALALLAGCNVESPAPSVTQIAPEEPPVVLTTFNLEHAPTVTLSVPDMHCQYSCAPKVMETLAEQPGVKAVQVELEGKTATVAVDPNQFDVDTAIAALVDVQFVNTTVKKDAESAQTEVAKVH